MRWVRVGEARPAELFTHVASSAGLEGRVGGSGDYRPAVFPLACEPGRGGPPAP